MKGHTLMGQLMLEAGRSSRGSKINCPAELKARAEALLHPASPLVELHQCWAQQGLMTIEGVVVELSAVRRVVSGKEAVPLRKILLKQDKETMKASLWRPVAVETLVIGETVRITHVKSVKTEYGVQVNTTSFTKVEKLQTTQEITILGVLRDKGATCSTSSPDLCHEVLLDNGETLQIQETLWEPSFEEAVKEGPLKVKVSVHSKMITAIKAL
ncbi:hypothetical protein KUCAC02_037001 [Xyrichtys novacula]|uniref:Uncharacterized protein n=1 Tax=Xyrichtys novacula TaxID=13765 RepID=A0AAV1F9C7_XYRNO|nr:hypothetical protein KUCAC02_037001 [Xyrichtys novacula]